VKLKILCKISLKKKTFLCFQIRNGVYVLPQFKFILLGIDLGIVFKPVPTLPQCQVFCQFCSSIFAAVDQRQLISAVTRPRQLPNSILAVSREFVISGTTGSAPQLPTPPSPPVFHFSTRPIAKWKIMFVSGSSTHSIVSLCRIPLAIEICSIRKTPPPYFTIDCVRVCFCPTASTVTFLAASIFIFIGRRWSRDRRRGPRGNNQKTTETEIVVEMRLRS
jgi:hypothetical protein